MSSQSGPDERPLYNGPIQIRVEFLERRMEKVESAVLVKNESLIRLDERTKHLSDEIGDMRADVSRSMSTLERTVRNMSRAFYGLGLLLVTVSLGVIADLITRGG